MTGAGSRCRWEFVDGITLKEHLENQKEKISFDMALKILVPVMDALKEIHLFNLLHLDINPRNIYITEKSQIKPLDFGAARYKLENYSESLSVIVRHGYSPPEQYQTRGEQGPWTDVYALAATFYRAITGKVPSQALDRLEKDDLVPPSSMGIRIPKNKEAILLKALAVKRENRIQTVKEFQDLMTAKKKNDIVSAATYSSDHEIEKEKIPIINRKNSNLTSNKRMRLITLLGGIAVALLLIVIYFLVNGVTQSPVEKPIVKDINGVVKPDNNCYKNSDGVWEKIVSMGNVNIFLVYVPPGEFIMGSPITELGRGDDEIPHKVRFTRGFWLGKHEVTQGQWKVVMGENPSRFKRGDNYPVEQVSWDDTQSYIKGLNRLTGLNFRLPTEAEWEYACRAGKSTVFHFGDRINPDQVNFNGDKTMVVGSFEPNTWGIYNMHGNVWEWCSDWYGKNHYTRFTEVNPMGPISGEKRVMRGGSWINRDSHLIRSAFRNFYNPSLRFEPGTRGGYFGFRLAMDSK